MSTDETELRGLRNLIEQTIQRAKAYPKRMTDPEAKHQAELTVDGLSDLSLCLEVRIKELANR